MATKSLTCQTCNRQWTIRDPKPNCTYNCPQCRLPLISLNREVSSSNLKVAVSQPTFYQSTSKAWLPWVLVAGGVTLLLMVGVIGMMVLVIVSNGSHALADSDSQANIAAASRKGVTASQSDQQRTSTKEAWDAMQRIDNQISNTKFSSASQRIQTTAVRYSQIDLIDVDRQLVDHFRDAIAVYQEAANLHSNLESELAVINKNTKEFAKFTGALGALGSKQKDARKNAIGGALVGGVFAELAQHKSRKMLKQKYTPLFDQLQQKLNRVHQQEMRLAKTLSEKYGTPFVDLF